MLNFTAPMDGKVQTETEKMVIGLNKEEQIADEPLLLEYCIFLKKSFQLREENFWLLVMVFMISILTK